MFVVAYAIGDRYFREADLLQASLERWGIPHRIDRISKCDFIPEGVPRSEMWNWATAYKAQFVSEMLDSRRGPVVYVDVDAVFHSDPSEYFDSLECDFGAHWFQGPSGGHNRDRNDDHFLSGTMFWNWTDSALYLCDRWVGLVLDRYEAGDAVGGGQALLKRALEDPLSIADLDVERIPGEYCYVFDKPWAYPEGCDPVIEHLIASRENRNREEPVVNDARQERISKLRREYEVE